MTGRQGEETPLTCAHHPFTVTRVLPRRVIIT